ncbi:flagellar biosynthesis/type III secretory pathway protein [Thermanaerovibrio velox DSM 12556]|uniref:Flagellar biosynthesis/type III secretory pathway protein n=1 Tax=Thermanaerovibrio velox DSM 12556 TaxID=926567 RepID=H0UPP3_9BACT|nr:FliH/SctL family protein [Thermanaerovibrio velox]EHM09590.1 flagellar biosynthesis/type III secretory pathway protein [Thermanaerovibrio velox DSM 12556]
MSSSRHRLLKAVRVLPEAVRIGAKARPSEDPLKGCPESPEHQSSAPSEEDLLRERIALLEEELRRASDRAAALEGELVSLKLRQEEEREAFLREAALKIQEARSRAEAEAREEGFRQGREEGLKSAREEMERLYLLKFQEALEMAERFHKSLEEEREALLGLLVPQMVRLWEKTLSRMLLDRVRMDEGAALRVLKGVLAKISDRERLLIYLNPDDHRSVEGALGELGDLLRGNRHLEVVPDPDVDKGSCIVETNLGVYDARWRTQLEQVGLQVSSLLFGGDEVEGD